MNFLKSCLVLAMLVTLTTSSFAQTNGDVTFRNKINEVIGHLDEGIPFMTDGCPGPDGEVGCTRPYGSYKPSEHYRDFPFRPVSNDVVQIRKELAVE